MEDNRCTVRLCNCMGCIWRGVGTGDCGGRCEEGRGCPVPGTAGSMAAAPQPRAEPVSGAGSASLETYLRKGKNAREE